MSDQIFINDITDCNSIIINDTVSQNVVNVVAEGSLVTSVNGRIGAIILSKNDVGLNEVDNTSDLNKPISSATLSALLLKADLSAFNVLNDLVLSQYGSWNSVYATVNILSGNWNSVYSNVNSNSGNFLQSQTFINSNSSNILQVNSTVNSTSANWNYAYNTVVGGLSSDLWNSTYTNFSKQSANNISVYAYVNANSGFESNQQNVTTFIISNSSNIINVNSLVNTTSANWNSVYSTWNSNSALDLAARTFVNLNSANIRQVNSTVNTTSANWNSAYNWVDTNKNNATFQTVSAISLSGVFYGDGSNLIGAALPGQADVNTLVRSNSGNWNSVYSTVQSNSATTWNYQGTDLKTLSSTWVGGNIAYTNLISNSAAYLSAVDLSLIQSTSANWNSVYSNVNSNSSNFLQSQTFVNANSSNIRQVNSLVNTTSANWNSVYSNVNSNSSTYATYGYVNNGFLPLSGGTISGATRINNNLTVFGNLTATGTTTFANTVFSVTSSLSVVHIGSGPALWVGNNGDGDIASFYDIDANVEILHVGGNNGSFPNVGVKTSTPNVDFTVNGQISANSTIWSAGGNSNNWNSVYSNVNLNSSNFLQSQTFVNSNSSNILQVNSIVNTTSANWNESYTISTEYQNTSGSFATNTLLQSTSALLTPLTTTNNLTSQLVKTTDLNSLSATLLTRTEYSSSSATLLPTSIYQNTSGSFATNTLLQSTSALLTPLTLTNQLTSQLVLNSTINELSGNWQSSYETVNTLSGNWDSVYTSWNSTSATLATIAFTDSKYLPLSGGILTGSIGINNNPLYFNIDSANIGNSYGDFGIGSSNDILINPNSNLILTQNIGNVGIGTTTPTTKLDVNGTITATGGSSDQWNETYTTYTANSASYATNTALNAASSVLLPTSIYQDASGNWQSSFETVNTLSGNWNSGFNAGTLYSQNSASYATYNYVNNGFLPLSGGTISGETRINNNLTVFGNLTATGTTTFANTIFSVTSSLSVVHIGSGPALWVGNNGTGDIASFYDMDQGVEVFHIGGNNGSFPNVGVKTSSPNVDFTVNGQISANNIIWDANGNSNNWNSAFNVATTYQNASASFAPISYVNNGFLPLSGGTMSGAINASGHLILNALDTNRNIELNSTIYQKFNIIGNTTAGNFSFNLINPRLTIDKTNVTFGRNDLNIVSLVGAGAEFTNDWGKPVTFYTGGAAGNNTNIDLKGGDLTFGLGRGHGTGNIPKFTFNTRLGTPRGTDHIELPLLTLQSDVVSISGSTNLTQTWNNALSTYTLLSANVVDIASNTASRLLDLQTNGTSQFRLTRGINFSGNASDLLNWGIESFPIKVGTYYGNAALGLGTGTNNSFFIFAASNSYMSIGGPNDGFQFFTSGTGPVKLFTDASNTLAQRNGTNTQTTRLYNTFTNSNNFERGSLTFSAPNSAFTIAAESSGTGLNRDIWFNTANATQMVITSGGNIGIGTITPASKLTVVGNISASGIIDAQSGNSNQWNNTFTTVQANSALWGTGGGSSTELQTLSGNWQSTYTTVQANSALWGTGGGGSSTELQFLSGNWQSTFVTVSSLSANWNSAFDISTIYSQNSAAYNDAVTITNNISAYYSATIPVSSYSAIFTGNGSTTTFDLSSTSSYTTAAKYLVSLNGAIQIPNVDYTINYTSGTNKLVTNFIPDNGSTISVILLSNWLESITFVPNDVVTTVRSTSATWNSTTATVSSLSANWQNASDALDFIIISTDFNAIVNRQYLVDTTSSNVVGTLPLSPAIGDNISFVDSNNTWGTRPLILNNNGNLLQTYNEPLTANISGYQFKIVYVGGSFGWKIV